MNYFKTLGLNHSRMQSKVMIEQNQTCYWSQELSKLWATEVLSIDTNRFMDGS